jgi:DNA polymerase-3 subunit beta
MKSTFLIEQKPLLAILSSMQPICGKRTTLDATSYIMFQVGYKELVLKSTDLEISLQANCLIKNSDVVEQQSFLVSGKRIFDLVKELEGDITFSFDAKQLGLKAGSVSVALNVKDAQEFPPFPERIENLMQLDATFLLDLLSKVAFLIPQNNANPALNGLLIEVDNNGLSMTTTDGHCLAQVHTATYMLEEKKQWLLPRRAIFEVKKILEADDKKAEGSKTSVFLGMCGNQLVVSGESFNFFSKLLADEFPEYHAILDKQGFKPATVDRAQLVKTLRRSVCLLSGQFIATHFEFAPEALQVSMKNTEVGTLQEELPLQSFEGEKLSARFYAPYLLSGLQAFSRDAIQFHLKNSLKPIIFEAEEQNHRVLYLVMPVSPTNNN